MSAGTVRGPDDPKNYSGTIDTARAYNGELCVRCTQADGCVVDFVAVPEVDSETWVGIRHDRHTDDVTDGWLTETHRVTTTIQRCDPDVALVEMSESLFGESDE